MPTVYPNTIDTPKEGKFDFSGDFVKVTNLLLDTYQEAMNVLEKITKNPEGEINDLYGVCNKTFKLRYITPSNIATYIDYLVKALHKGPDALNVGDLEMLSVELIRQFIHDNKECVPLDNTNVFPTGTYLSDRCATMEEIVLVCRNEYYDTSVYSKSDMINRAEAIGESVKLLDTLRFAANAKRLISSIPDILNRNAQLSVADNMVAEEFIKRFIQTATMINLAAVEQLIAYCIPRTSYNLTRVTTDPNKRFDYDYYGESVDLTKYSPVFINLSHGGDDIVHKSIRKFNDADWAHSSISFDPHMGVMYTMNGGPFNDDVYGKQKPGFQREALHSSKYNDILVRVYAILVPNEVVAKMKDVVANLETANVKYDYKAIWKKARDAHAQGDENPYKQICSTLVNAVIALAGEPLSDEEVASPEDLNKAAEVRPNQVLKVYEGPGSGYDYDDAMEKIEAFAAGEKTVPYSEQFVTESCMLKTADMCIRGKVPFNCNMRDVVLLDTSSEYKDVRNAVSFIMGDSRSPVASLVRKYRTRDEYPLVNRILPMFIHIKPYNTNPPADGKPRNKWEMGMHTDTGWLDKITYGDEFLDGNYRDDALGNNKFTPITHTLRTLYDMFKCDDMKSNEDLANNVYDIACAIMDITQQFDPQFSDMRTIEDREVVRDILVVLAEIMTRSMLKLFYNNTLCLSASDDMPDTMVPGYMYTEGFVMEATSPEPNQKVGVTVTDAAGKALANNKNIGQKIADMMKKFINWLSTTFAKIAGKFSNDHKAEIDWVTKNMQLNNEIKNALAGGTFNITLSGFVPYQVPLNTLVDPNSFDFSGGVKAMCDKIEKGEIKDANGVNLNALLSEIIKSQDLSTLKADLTKEGVTDRDRATTMQNFVLWGKNGVQAIPTTPPKLTADQWMQGDGDNVSGIVGDIIHTGPAISKFAAANVKAATDAAKIVDEAAKKAKPEQTAESTLFDVLAPIFQEEKVEVQKVQVPKNQQTQSQSGSTTAQTSEASKDDTNAKTDPSDAQPTNNNQNTDKSALYQALSTSLTAAQNLLGTNTINTLIRKFYASNYKIYRDIVTAYKSQAKTQEQPAQATQTQTQGTEQPAASETPAAHAEG